MAAALLLAVLSKVKLTMCTDEVDRHLEEWYIPEKK